MTADPKPTLSPEEMQRRRKACEVAKHENRIEGIPHDPATDPIFEAWIVGEIDSEEALARIKAYLGLPEAGGEAPLVHRKPGASCDGGAA